MKAALNGRASNQFWIHAEQNFFKAATSKNLELVSGMFWEINNINSILSSQIYSLEIFLMWMMAAKNHRKCIVNCGHDNFEQMPHPVSETVRLYRVAATASGGYQLQSTSKDWRGIMVFFHRKPVKFGTLLLVAAHASRYCYHELPSIKLARSLFSLSLMLSL
jgi:hypothetical protein